MIVARRHNGTRHDRLCGTLPWLLRMALTLSAFLRVPAQAQPEAAAVGRTPCPQEIVRLLTKGREKMQAGNLLTAKQDYYEPLLQNEELEHCSVDLRLKAHREYGDLLVNMARRKTADEQAEYKRLAAEQYQQYLLIFTKKGQPNALAPPEEQQFPRVVLNAYANMTFETKDFSSLCDVFADLAQRMPDLFDSKALEKWKKTLETAPWDNTARAVRLSEYCKLFQRPALRLSDGARAELVSRCTPS